jgi:hypothetical protein
MFKKLIFTFLIVFGIAGWGWGATYYISKDAGNPDTKVCVDTVIGGTSTCNTTVSAVVASKNSGDIFVLDGGASGVTFTAAEMGLPIKFSNTNQLITSTLNPVYQSAGHIGSVTLDAETGNFIIYSNAKAGFKVSYLTIINSTGATGRGVAGDSTGTIEYCKFRNNLYHVKAGSNSTTTTIQYNDFQGPATTAASEIFADTGTGIMTIQYNLFRPYGSVGGGTSYGYGGGINIQGTGTYNIYNNVFAGSTTAVVWPFGTPASGTINFENNMVIGAGAINTATGGIVSCVAGQTCTVSNNYITVSAVSPVAPITNADTAENNIFSVPPYYITSSRRGWVTFSIDDYNPSRDTWGNLCGATGTNPSSASDPIALTCPGVCCDGRIREFVARGLKMTWYVPTGDAINQTDYLIRLAWAKNNNVEIGLHTRGQSSLSVADGTKIWDTSGNVTVDRTADTITSAGGTVTGFKAKTLKAIKLELEAAPHSLTVTRADIYNAYGSGSINELTKGECLKDSGPGTTVLVKVTDHTAGLLKAEIVDALAELEGFSGIGVGTVKSFSYPYGENNAAAKAAVFAAGLTNSRVVNIDMASSQHISNLDPFIIGMFNPVDVKANTTSGDGTEDIKANINGLMAYLAETGSIADIHSHSSTELSVAQWITVLDEVMKWNGKVTYTMTINEALTDIRTFTGDASGSISYAWTDAPNYKLMSNSPAIDAGVNLCGVTASCTGAAAPYACCTGEGTGNCIANSTDYAGKPRCVSGVFAGRLSEDIGAYLFPTVGQSTQKNLNLLWVGR